MEFKRYLQLTITPKSHIIEDRSCKKKSILNGIGDLEESFEDKNHQYESISDRGHGGTHAFTPCETIKEK